MSDDENRVSPLLEFIEDPSLKHTFSPKKLYNSFLDVESNVSLKDGAYDTFGELASPICPNPIYAANVDDKDNDPDDQDTQALAREEEDYSVDVGRLCNGNDDSTLFSGITGITTMIQTTGDDEEATIASLDSANGEVAANVGHAVSVLMAASPQHHGKRSREELLQLAQRGAEMNLYPRPPSSLPDKREGLVYATRSSKKIKRGPYKLTYKQSGTTTSPSKKEPHVWSLTCWDNEAQNKRDSNENPRVRFEDRELFVQEIEWNEETAQQIEEEKTDW